MLFSGFISVPFGKKLSFTRILMEESLAKMNHQEEANKSFYFFVQAKLSKASYSYFVKCLQLNL